MLVYYFLIVFSFVIYVINSWGLDKRKCDKSTYLPVHTRKAKRGRIQISNTSIYVFIVSAVIFLIMGFRDFSVGADTSRYVLIFTEHLYGEGNNIMTARTDWLYTIFNNFFLLFMTPRMYILMLSFIFVIAIVKFGVAEADNVLLFLFFYITIGIFSMNMSGVRQSLAVCITFLAYYFAKNKHLLIFLVLIGIAFLVHNSAIIFVLTYPAILFCEKKSKIWTIVWFILPLIAFLPFIPDIVIMVVQRAHLTKFLQNLGSTGINLKCFIFYYGLLCTTTILDLYERVEMSHRDIRLFRMGILGCACYAIAPNFYLFDRLAMYFIPFLIAYYVNSLQKLKNASSRKLAVFLCMSISAVWFISSTINGSLSIDNYIFGL